MGLSGRTKDLRNIITGNMDDHAFGGMRFRPTLSDLNSQDQRTSDRNYNLKTNFNVPEPIGISFSSIDLKWSDGYVVYADTSKIDSTRVFPDFSVNASATFLNKIPLVKQNMESVQLSSGFNYVVRERKNGTKTDFDDMKSTGFSYSPLIGIDGTLKKWPVHINYSHTYATRNEESSRSKNKTRSTDHDNKLGVRYEINKATGGKEEFKFLFWTVPIKGRIETGLEGNYATNVAETSPIEEEKFDKTANSTTISASPHASYDFTDNITGEVKYTGTKKKDLLQTMTSHIFSLSVMIRF
jgi:hypothetical protein